MVIDALNSEVVTRHHFEAYGFFSSALKDYVEQGLFPYDDRGSLQLSRHGDQIRKIPKYMINASGDEFFPADNSQSYFVDLKGEKYIRYEPNAKHNLAGSEVRENPTAVLEGVHRHAQTNMRVSPAWQKGTFLLCLDMKTYTTLGTRWH